MKSKELVEKKMKERVSSSGGFLTDAMNEAEDPIDVILKDPEAYAKKLVDGITDAIKRGSYKVGLEKAKKRNAWKGATERAGAHYAERADDMVKNALEDYDARAAVIQKVKNAIKDMPTATRAQRIAKSAKYQELVGAEFDKLYGRK